MSVDLMAFLQARFADDEREQSGEGWHTRECATTHDGDQVHDCDCGVPARVLADMEGKRELLKLHQPEEVDEYARRSWYTFTIQCKGESWKVYADAEERVEWPCRTLRLLALPYAEHPEYRPEWRP